MAHLFEIIVPFLAFGARSKDQAKIDNFTFRLHYRFTSAVLFLATALLALNNFFGKEIQCFDNEMGKAKDAITQYCFVTGTFTVPGRSDGRLIETCNMVQTEYNEEYNVTKIETIGMTEGGGAEFSSCSETDDDCCRKTSDKCRCKKVHNYYQWVAYILVLQGVLFLLPHQLWSIMEGGRVNAMVNAINGNKEDTEGRKKRDQVIRNIAKFIHSQQASANANGHIRSGAVLKKYTFAFLVCHTLNLINVIVNINLLNTFFEGRFTEFGTRWLESSEKQHSVLPDIFPRTTGCTWRQFGSGGYPKERTYLCILATNVATEKVFIFLWFWYLVLFLISLGSFLYYSALLLSRDVDWRIFCLKITRTREECNQEGMIHNNECCWVDYIKEMSSGQFFLLYLLAKNIEPCLMHKLVQGMAQARSSPPTYRSSIMNMSMQSVGLDARPPTYRQASLNSHTDSNVTWHGSTHFTTSLHHREKTMGLSRETSFCGAFPSSRPTLHHSPSAPAFPSTKEETTFH